MAIFPLVKRQKWEPQHRYRYFLLLIYSLPLSFRGSFLLLHLSLAKDFAQCSVLSSPRYVYSIFRHQAAPYKQYLPLYQSTYSPLHAGNFFKKLYPKFPEVVTEPISVIFYRSHGIVVLLLLSLLSLFLRSCVRLLLRSFFVTLQRNSQVFLIYYMSHAQPF
jgi:hypothetical protein